MTKNQQRAVALAQRIIEDRETPLIVDDADWHLLLLAAGLNYCRVHPLTAALRVLECAEGRTGYFTACGGLMSCLVTELSGHASLSGAEATMA